MAKFAITDPTSGKTVTVEGSSPPSQSDAEQIFKDAGLRTKASTSTPAPSAKISNPITDTIGKVGGFIAPATTNMVSNLINAPKEIGDIYSLAGKDKQAAALKAQTFGSDMINGQERAKREAQAYMLPAGSGGWLGKLGLGALSGGLLGSSKENASIGDVTGGAVVGGVLGPVLSGIGGLIGNQAARTAFGKEGGNLSKIANELGRPIAEGKDFFTNQFNDMASGPLKEKLLQIISPADYYKTIIEGGTRKQMVPALKQPFQKLSKNPEFAIKAPTKFVEAAIDDTFRVMQDAGEALGAKHFTKGEFLSELESVTKGKGAGADVSKTVKELGTTFWNKMEDAWRKQEGIPANVVISNKTKLPLDFLSNIKSELQGKVPDKNFLSTIMGSVDNTEAQMSKELAAWARKSVEERSGDPKRVRELNQLIGAVTGISKGANKNPVERLMSSGPSIGSLARVGGVGGLGLLGGGAAAIPAALLSILSLASPKFASGLSTAGQRGGFNAASQIFRKAVPGAIINSNQ